MRLDLTLSGGRPNRFMRLCGSWKSDGWNGPPVARIDRDCDSAKWQETPASSDADAMTTKCGWRARMRTAQPTAKPDARTRSLIVDVKHVRGASCAMDGTERERAGMFDI